MRYLLFALALATVAPAYATPIDMATQTCQDWLDADDDVQDGMVAWLSGYLAGRSTSSLYDPAAARGGAQMLKSYCQAHPTASVLTAAGQNKH